MKKSTKIYLLSFLFFAGLFFFWTFSYRYHILFTEKLSFFLYSSDFWRQFVLQPRGWSVYCGNFLSQFYINFWAGALIQTLLPIILLAASIGIMKKTGAKDSLLLTAVFPVLLLIAMQLDYRFTPGDALALICPFALALPYMSITNIYVRRFIYILVIIPVYLFSGALATCSLYAACVLYELFFAKDKWKYATPVLLLAAVLLPFVWQMVHLMPLSRQFDPLSFSPPEGVGPIPYLLLASAPLGIIAVKYFSRKQKFGKSFSLITCSVLIIFGYYLFQKSFNRLEEQKFGMNLAVAHYNWDQVLRISRQVKDPDSQTAYFANLALSVKGELPQKMFQYPQTDVYGLFLLRMPDDFSMCYGSDFYYQIGIINEAIRWIFDANIERGKGMDYHTLTRLAVWSRKNGYEQVAAKYFDILEETLMYRAWAKQQRNSPVRQPENNADSPTPEFFIGGRLPITDMAYYYDSNPNNLIVLDYLLCSQLLENQLERFLALFKSYYPLSSREIPQTYQDALLYLADSGKTDIKDFPITPSNIARFNNFKDLANKRQNSELERRFGDTFWYHSWKRKK